MLRAEKGNILDSASSRTRAEPLSDVLAKVLAHQRHPVNAEGAQGRRGIEEPGDDLDVGRVIGSIDRVGRSPPVWNMSEQIEKDERMSYAPRPK